MQHLYVFRYSQHEQHPSQHVAYRHPQKTTPKHGMIVSWRSSMLHTHEQQIEAASQQAVCKKSETKFATEKKAHTIAISHMQFDAAQCNAWHWFGVLQSKPELAIVLEFHWDGMHCICWAQSCLNELATKSLWKQGHTVYFSCSCLWEASEKKKTDEEFKNAH
jgi:hypothetical protein